MPDRESQTGERTLNPPESLPPTSSVSQVAKYLGVSNKTVYNLLKQGELSCLSGLRVKRITRKSIEAYLERSEVVPA